MDIENRFVVGRLSIDQNIENFETGTDGKDFSCEILQEIRKQLNIWKATLSTENSVWKVKWNGNS